MRVRHRKAVAFAALVLGMVGCGLSLAVDPLGPFTDAGPDGTSNPNLDVSRPDAVVADAKADIDLGDVVFLPSNLDAAADAYHLGAATDLTNVVRIAVSTTTADFSNEAGAIGIPGSDIVDDPECGCIVVSVKRWVVPAGSTVTIETEKPLVLVASAEARIDGVVKVISKNAKAPPRGGNSQTGGAGGGASVVGGGGGAAPEDTTLGVPGSPRSDGGAALTPVKLPAVGMTGGPAFTSLATCGRGGLGAGGFQLFSRKLTVAPGALVSASGEPGGAGCLYGGGGGGGSGGTVFLEGAELSVEGTVFALGGGGGGGGSSDPAISDASAGAPGSEGGAGGRAAPPCTGNGGSGQNGGGGADASTASCGGGGGGGAPGFVRFRGIAVTTSGSVAPPAVAVPP